LLAGLEKRQPVNVLITRNRRIVLIREERERRIVGMTAKIGKLVSIAHALGALRRTTRA
jgi:hypothetical protein